MKTYKITLSVSGEQTADNKEEALSQFYDDMMISGDGDVMQFAVIEEK